MKLSSSFVGFVQVGGLKQFEMSNDVHLLTVVLL